MDALTMLWRRLRAEAERAAASPAERLLDDVLLLQSAPMSSEERKRQVNSGAGVRCGMGMLLHVGIEMKTSVQSTKSRRRCQGPCASDVSSHALQDGESRLAAAFKPLGNRAVDVFAMAEALSQRESSGSAGSGSGMLDDIVEFVPKVCNRHAFAP